eukprot:CAMPEP_0182420846 /NCGR_PEP_ID=MMETSP1167-20130531/5926_1 /TAXON_ID=2988 /ORGANISM="Mallomonas Sp, Strain CCMP3275" /LENGTH=496 /DNA_ID=CAMNT_0024597343 /DNA_START=60 /DNA_END=1551 /DNA_ORIENTATION=+
MISWIQVVVVLEFMIGNTGNVMASESVSREMLSIRCGANPWKKAPWFDKLNQQPIRGVNLGGHFVLEPWITPDLLDISTSIDGDKKIVDQYTFSLYCNVTDSCHRMQDHWDKFYVQEDFDLMKEYNLNTVRVPVGYWYFSELSGFPTGPFILPNVSILSPTHPITKVIRMADNAGLQVILDLHGAPGSQNGFDNSGQAANVNQSDADWGTGWLNDTQNVQGTVDTTAAMATYIGHLETVLGIWNVMAIEVLNEPYVNLELAAVHDFYLTAMNALRVKHGNIPIILHDSFRLSEWGSLLDHIPHRHVYMDDHNYFAFMFQKESDLEEDKDLQGLFSRMICNMKPGFHTASCKTAPVLVGEWSLAINNCMERLDARFEDIGQCTHMEDRLESQWWKENVRDFALRQMEVYESGLGWVFWNWKLDSTASLDPSAPYWSFLLAVKHGFIDTKAYGEKKCDFSSVQGGEVEGEREREKENDDEVGTDDNKDGKKKKKKKRE